MILIATNSRDLTSDFVILELQRRRLAYYRLNTEEITSARIEWRPGDGGRWQITTIEEQLLDVSAVLAGYYRRPGTPEPAGSVNDPGERFYCSAEWESTLWSIYGVIGSRWFNSPHAISLAEDKPRQLAAALTVGFAIPETLVTNDFDEASRFVLDGPTVGKPLREALLGGSAGERVIFTTRIASLHPSQRAAVQAAPMILQREISKRYDVRVTIVGERVFAASIHSQVVTETQVDWRRGSRPDLVHEQHTLPGEVAVACVSMIKALGLKFGAIDLILDRDGRYWFLEANPNGQWAWIESRTGLPIAAAIVDELEAIAAC